MGLIFVLPFAAIVFTGIYYCLTWPYDYWKKQGVLTAKSIIPGFGNTLRILLFRENLNIITDRIYKSCHPDSSMIGMFHLRTPALIVRDPELVQTVFVKEFVNFNINLVHLDEKRDWFFSKNPFYTVGDAWKRNRKLIISGMSQRKLKIMFESMQRVSANSDEYFDCVDRSEVELKDLCHRFIFEILFQVGFGIKPEENLVMDVKEVFKSTWFRAVRQLLNFFVRDLANVTGISFTPRESQKFFGELATNIVEKHKTEKGMNHDDFLHMIMDNSDEVNEEMVLTILTSLLPDGFDTTAVMGAVILYRLAWNQEAQEKLRKEIFHTFVTCNGKLTYEALKDMTYLDNVINEALRMNATLEINAKICSETTTLEGSDGQKCTLQPGNIVIIPTQSLQMDEKYWVNPNAFDPDRFDRDEVTKFTFLPFGEGPRMCPGMKFALMELKILLISVLKKCRVKPTEKTITTLEMDPRSFLPAVVGELHVQIEKIQDRDLLVFLD